MSGIMRIGLRLVRTTRSIPNNNPTKYLQPMCHVRNNFIHVPKNLFTSAQKKSAGYWKKTKITLISLCFFMFPITIIWTYKKVPGILEAFRTALDEVITVAEKGTLKHSILPLTIVTSSVLLDDDKIQIKTQKDNIRLMNDNTHILMGSKDMDESILEPFPKGKPIPIKIGKLNGLLDNGKLTLTTEDGDTTWNLKEMDFNLPHENEIIPVIGKFSLSCNTRVKIQKDKSEKAYHFTQMVHLECDKKLDENTQSEIATKIKSSHEITEEMKLCDVIIDSGIVVCKTHNGDKIAARRILTCEVFEDAQKESAWYWKKISAVAIKTLKYSTIPLTVIAVYSAYKAKPDPKLPKNVDTMAAARQEEFLKYSKIPSTIVTSSVLFDTGEIQIKTQKDSIHLMNDNTRIVMGSKEMDASILEPFPKGKPIPIKIGKFNGLLDNGKLTLKTEDGRKTYTFHHTVGLEVKKLSETSQNEIAVNDKEQPQMILWRKGKFSCSSPGFKMTMKTPEREKKWTYCQCMLSDPNSEEADSKSSSQDKEIIICGNFSSSCDSTVKLQNDESDEVAVRLLLTCELFEDDEQACLTWKRRSYYSDSWF
ncbi:hypothetical protein HCN44_006054 [Aphidius gifuensis]|uniref:Uncharacterized protein n=1 Tax=Aphidius gifuensis TaxID=684658 RepID=A0A834Y1H7_APHGI|nr:hypothetical protein HCN44_006054 [Aphidius gifuensis]